MQKSRVRRVGALIVGLSLIAAACGDDEDETPATEAAVETTEAAVVETTEAAVVETTEAMAVETTEAAAASGGELAGMKGTTPKSADVGDWIPAVSDFWVAQGNDPLEDFNYAAEAYDSVVVIALAVHKAGTDGAAFAGEIVGITGEGEECSSFVECRDIIDAGGDPDYQGVSGPHDFNGNGEPLKGSYAVLTFGDDNRLTGEEVLIEAQSPDSSIVDLVLPQVEREGDGILKIGSILPETGSLAFLAAPMFAGTEFAIDEINAAGGVLGAPIEYSQGDSGDTSTDTATVTATRLLGENVDAMVGPASSGVALTIIDQISAAGVVLFSPANTSPALSSYDDKGFYFRNAPPDGLQGAIVANLVLEDGNASAYILNLDDAYGNGIAEVVAAVLESSGVEVLGVKAYDPTAASFDAEVDEVVAADPDAIVLISFDEGSRILRTAVEKGIGPTAKNYYGTDGNMGNALGENFDAGA